MTGKDIFGTDGNDFLVGTPDDDSIFGLLGDDTLKGRAGDDFLDGGEGKDILRGGSGADTFTFELFGSPTRTPNGIFVSNNPDIVQDFHIGEDTLNLTVGSFSGDTFPSSIAANGLKFQSGISSELSGKSNLLVLEDPFPNAAAAAKAIADNNKLTADEGLFVYFNSTLGIARFARSGDLSDGGDVFVLANLENIKNPADLAEFSRHDFSFVALT